MPTKLQMTKDTPRTPQQTNGQASPILSADVLKLVEENKGIFLDIGCSDHKSKGSIGMDIRACDGVDIVHDIRAVPWPLPATCCKRILASHIIEHLPPDTVFPVIDECWRVMQPHGQLFIAMPYANSTRALQDPSHYRCWNEVCAQYFCPDYGLYDVYRPKPWHIVHHQWDSIGDLLIVLAKLTMEEAATRQFGTPLP